MSPHLALSNSRQYIAVKLGPARPGGNSSIFLSERTVLLGGFRRNVCTAAILRERPAAHGKKPWAECRRRCTSYTSPRSPFNSPPCDCQRGEDSRQNTISEAEYHEFADSTMVKLLDSLDEFYEQVQVDKMDISFSDGVLNLSLGDLGTYVINKQPPNRQIWLSSPVSGPCRFDVDPSGKWICKKTGATMEDMLSQELRTLLNCPVDIKC